jgi:hypothetical protein
MLFVSKYVKVNICEFRKVMFAFDIEATKQGFPPKEVITFRDATTYYHHGKRASLSIASDSGIVARMKWSSIDKFMNKKKVMEPES